MVTTWIQILKYTEDSRLSERSFPASPCTHFLIPQTERNTAQVPMVKPFPSTWQPDECARPDTCRRGSGAQGFPPSVLYVRLHIRYFCYYFLNPSTFTLLFSSFPARTTVLLYQLHPDFLMSLFNPDFFIKCLSKQPSSGFLMVLSERSN